MNHVIFIAQHPAVRFEISAKPATRCSATRDRDAKVHRIPLINKITDLSAFRILGVGSADQFYSAMGMLIQEMLELNMIDCADLIREIYTMAPIPFPEVRNSSIILRDLQLSLRSL